VLRVCSDPAWAHLWHDCIGSTSSSFSIFVLYVLSPFLVLFSLLSFSLVWSSDFSFLCCACCVGLHGPHCLGEPDLVLLHSRNSVSRSLFGIVRIALLCLPFLESSSRGLAPLCFPSFAFAFLASSIRFRYATLCTALLCWHALHTLTCSFPCLLSVRTSAM